MTPPPVIRIKDLWAGFKSRGRIHYVLRDAKMEIRQGELVCLVGPSGSGKSVLLNLLIGSLRPGQGGFVMKGLLEVLGKNLEKRFPSSLTKGMGIVFQESALFEDLSTRENAAFGLERQGASRRVIEEKVGAILEAVDLKDPPRRIHELSGGQKKRLALARTLATEPGFLIFDEPTTGLDPHLCRQIADLIRRTHEAGLGMRTTLVVTHDYESVLAIATRVFLINPAKGCIEELKKGEDPSSRFGKKDDADPASRGKSLPFTPTLGLFPAMTFLFRPIAQFAANPWPGSLRQSFLRFADALIHPLLYICAASAVLGGLATFFALENNPLKGAMDRQALIGLGKVLMAIVIPLMTSILFAARVGAGATARLGNIRLGRQDDSLRMLGADPGAYLVTPLFWSCLLGLPLLTLPAGVASALASLGAASTVRPITSFGWATSFFSELNHLDFFFAMLKLVGSGGLVAVVAAGLGLRQKSSAEDLGRDVTGTIVMGTFLVILWHGFWTFIQYAP